MFFSPLRPTIQQMVQKSSSMLNRYRRIDTIGEGAYGVVYVLGFERS